ncbi:fibrous sheath-interacting protein 2-like [Tachysurus fulvidraco]|uniref:fibrous sheath-interacting protein 2-like n=1 Tax=Tachysurus fulvidraco TaxID=1234273 RepID=UPI000F4E8EE3|nr:fibrous sheath-interacting protein 2-like [Tachysurus fulvidraco]
MSGRNKREKKNGLKKKPGSDAPHKTYSRGELGESIFESCPDFNLDDPDMKLMSMEYNSLHDPHLKHFFNQRGKKKHLKKLGLITHDNKVLCTLKEFRDYMRYREALHLSCEKYLLEKQTYLLKHFIILKQKGEMPEAFSVSDMIDLLINKGMDTFRKMYKQNIKAGRNLYYDEVMWKVRQRLQLEKIEKEMTRELRLKHRFQDRKKALSKPVRTALTSKVDSSSRSLPPPALQTLHEETDESLTAFHRPGVSAGLTGLVGIINKISSESPGESANVMEEFSSKEKSPKDQVQTAVLEELNKFVTEILAPCLMLDTEDSKNPPMGDSTVHPHISEDVMKFAVDKVISLLSPTEAPGSSETETLEPMNLKSAVLTEMMVKDPVKEMVEDWVQFDIQQKSSFRDEVQPASQQTPQSHNQHSHEIPGDLSSDTSEGLGHSLPNNLTRDIVKSALDRVSVVISGREALFSQQKSDKVSRGSDSSSSSSLEKSDELAESTSDGNNPVRLCLEILSHLQLETRTALYETLQGILSKIESGDLSDWTEPTVSPENIGMILDLITEILKVCNMEEDTSDAQSSQCKKRDGK